MKLETKYCSLPGINIAFSENGSGFPLLMLHGNSENKEQFNSYQLDYFSGYHTYALDSRGHGKSKSRNFEYSIEQYSEDVIRFCEINGIKKAYVIGYSDGGNISLFLAKKRPDMFTKIAAISPNYLASGTKDFWLGVFRIAHGLMKAFSAISLSAKNEMKIIELMLNDIGISEEEFRQIKANLLITYASDDMIKESHILGLAGLINGTRAIKIENSTHLNILYKEQTVKTIREYLQ